VEAWESDQAACDPAPLPQVTGGLYGLSPKSPQQA
jgi:hypothetical protein